MTPNEKLDAIDVMIEPVYPPIIVRRAVTKNLYLRPGRFIPIFTPTLFPFEREGQRVWMTPESAHANRVVGCLHYQWLRLVRYAKEKRWTRLAHSRPR
jgi:hypothetical protein